MGKRKENKIIILNMISTFILQGIAFVSTPIFTRILGARQFGIYALFNSWVLIVTCIMGCSLCSSIGTGLYTYKKNYLMFRNSLLLSSTLICLVQFLLCYIFRKSIAKLLGFSTHIVVLIAICAFAHYIVNFAQLCFIYEKRAWSNFVLSISVAFLSVILSLVFISRMNSTNKYLGRIYGVTMVYTISAVISFLFLYLPKPAKINKDYLKYGLLVGFPIVFHSLSQQVLGQSDRVMMQFFGIGTDEIGIYSLFYTLSAVLATVLNALNNSWCPFYYDDVSEEKWNLLDKKCKNYIELFSVLGVGFLLLSREVSYLMADESYWSGMNIIPILTFAVYFTFMYQFPVNFEFFHKKTKIIAIGTVGAGILNIILNAIMIPKWGMYGAAIATAISYLALFFAHYYIVIHMKEHPYHLNIKIFIPGLICMMIGALLFYVFASYWYVRWGLGIILGCFELYRIYKRKSIF